MSSTIVRAAGNGVRHEIAEMYCRFERLKLHTASVVQNVKNRAHKQTRLLNEMMQQLKADSIARIDEAVHMYNTVDNDQQRWIAKHDWHNYDDGINAKSFQVSASKVDTLPKLAELHSSPQKKKVKSSTSIAMTTSTASCSKNNEIPRMIRRATRSTKSLQPSVRTSKSCF